MEEIQIKKIYSGRRTLCLEIKPGGEVILRLPYGTDSATAEKFLSSHEKWLEKHLKNRARQTEPTEEEIKNLRASAKTYIPPKLEYYSKLMGLTPTGMKITSAKRSFGSCSGKNSVCFSLYLMKYPLPAVDYVIVHELAHIRYKNHGKSFYALIEKYIPDYRERRSLLKGDDP